MHGEGFPNWDPVCPNIREIARARDEGANEAWSHCPVHSPWFSVLKSCGAASEVLPAP